MKKLYRYAICAAALAALLAGNTYVTWRIASGRAVRAASAPAVGRAEAADPLSAFRLEREQLRAREQAQLNDIVYSDRSDAATIARAQAQLLSLVRRSEQEATLEGILQSRGFDDAVVSVGERSANALIRAHSLTERETAVILELIMRETGLTGGNVKIIPVK